MGCCQGKKKAKGEKSNKKKTSSGRRKEKDHSASSLKSRSPSIEDLDYQRARTRRTQADGSYSETYIKCKNASPTVHVHFYQSGQNVTEQAANFYNTYQAPKLHSLDSSYYSRPPLSPPPLAPCPTQEFTPGAMRSALSQNSSDAVEREASASVGGPVKPAAKSNTTEESGSFSVDSR